MKASQQAFYAHLFDEEMRKKSKKPVHERLAKRAGVSEKHYKKYPAANEEDFILGMMAIPCRWADASAGASAFFRQCCLKSFAECFKNNLQQSYEEVAVGDMKTSLDHMVPTWDGSVLDKFVHQYNEYVATEPERSWVEDTNESRVRRYRAQMDSVFVGEFDNALKVMAIAQPYFWAVATKRQADGENHAVYVMGADMRRGVLAGFDPTNRRSDVVTEREFVGMLLPKPRITDAADGRNAVQPPAEVPHVKEAWEEVCAEAHKLSFGEEQPAILEELQVYEERPKTVLPSGNAYTGQWVDGKREGHGTIEYMNGSVYTGQFKAGQLHGDGRKTWATGECYEGQFQANQYHGAGRIAGVDGSSYEGQFQADQQHGTGRCVWASGNSYEGQWQANKKHGIGVETSAGGAVRKAEFSMGKFVKLIT